MLETKQERFNRLCKEQNVKLNGVTHQGDTVVEKVYNKCPVCGKIHELERHRRTTIYTYNIGVVKFTEEYFHCGNAEADKNNYYTSLQFDETEENRQTGLLELIEKERKNDIQ